MERLSIQSTSRCQMIDITRKVSEVVANKGVTSGICNVFIPHTTAGITINENADSDVVRDILWKFDKMIPENEGYKHFEGNSDAHIKASIMGFSVQIIIEDGQLVLGQWQGIYFCEFDGPRRRKIYIKIT